MGSKVKRVTKRNVTSMLTFYLPKINETTQKTRFFIIRWLSAGKDEVVLSPFVFGVDFLVNLWRVNVFCALMEISLKGHRVILLPQKALHFPDEKILIISDLHFGKVNHFRRSGIPVPLKANDKNTETLIELFSITKPERVIFLGDLFHSHYNDEWEVIGQVIKHYQTISFELVQGNHDVMSQHQYERHRVKVYDQLDIDSLVLTHEPLEEIDEGRFNLAGHIHPGVRLSGRGRQALTLPCFYFGEKLGLMPAFGEFTGLASIRVKKDDRVFVVADGKIIKVSDE